jgi:amino acid adenylation domain-containing protein
MVYPIDRFPDSFSNCHTLVELLSYRAVHQGEQLAFIFLQDGEAESARLTYRELDRQSRAIAAQLQSMQLQGERALLLYPSGLDYLAAFFGCLYAGVIAVPAYPPRNWRNTPRILSMITDAQATIALTTTATISKIRSLLADTEDIDAVAASLQWLTTDDVIPGFEKDWQLPAIAPETLAFLQYTSGSTGTPKGAMLSHGNLLHNAAMTYQLMEHSSASCFVSWLPTYHDMGLIGGILQPLYGGFPCVLMAPASFLQRPYRWLHAISRYGGTTSGGPNFAYDLCVDKITPEQRQTLDLSRWTVAFNGAEPVRSTTLERFSDTFANCGFRHTAFYPCYGMAEATLMVSGVSRAAVPHYKTVDKAALEAHRVIEDRHYESENLSKSYSCDSHKITHTLVGCGQTLPQQQIVIVHSETLCRCQPNEVGEIWVAGPSVGQGYWNRSEDTDRTFRAYLSDTEEGPFLRTGDLGFLHAGELFVTGRLKDLIIIRGRNLYPQDIERTAEQSHPCLRSGSSAAFTVEFDQVEQLVVVLEIEFRQQPDAEQVIAAIRQSIAETYEIQAYAIVLIKPGTIPKTTSGKIQRQACRAAFLADQLQVYGCCVLSPVVSANRADQGSEFTLDAFLNLSREEQFRKLLTYLQAIIAQLLRTISDRIDSNSSLLASGLDSLKLFELKNRIEDDLQIAIETTDLFDGIPLIELIDRILNQIPSHRSIEISNSFSFSLERLTSLSEVAVEYPLSFAQQRLWLIQQLDAENAAYHIPLSIRLTGKLNISALERSLNELIQRHAILRTRFSVSQGQPVQIIDPVTDPTSALNLPIAEYPDVHDSAVDLQTYLSEDIQRPFNLATELPIRVKLLQFSNQTFILLLVLHHLVADGQSIDILLRDLVTLYEANATGQPMPLPELPIQYSDFAVWQRQQFQDGTLEASLRYWQQQLAGTIPILNLPIDYPRPPIQRFRGTRQTLLLPKALANALKTLSQQEGTTMFMTLLAAFNILLYRYTGQTDIWIGSPIAGRHQRQVESLIGCFVNMIVLRTNLEANPSIRDVLQRVRQVALDAYTHPDVPFEKLVEVLQPDRDLSYMPLVQVMVAFQSAPILPLSQLNWQVEELDTETSKFDLTLFVQERTIPEDDSAWTIILEYNTDLFASATITRLLGHFQTVLEGIVADPDRLLSDLSLLTQPERHQLLVEWNQTQSPASPYASLHQWFEAQVVQTPNAIAVQCGIQSLTYETLNQRANQLAHYLCNQGVQTERLVGLCVDRSLEMLIGILGILKAGGAYVPIDPTYPKDRIAFMLHNADVAVLLTQQPILERGILEPEPTATTVVCLDADWSTIAQFPDHNPDRVITPENLAYVIYTSGSTGKPKGTLIHHQGLMNYLGWCTQTYAVAQGKGTIVHSSISFDMTITGLFSPLLVGRSVELLPESFGIDALTQTFRQRRDLSLVKVTPAQLQLLSQQLSPREVTDRTQAFIIGGETLVAEQVEFWQTAAPKTVLVNEYGPTETVVGCCTYRVSDRIHETVYSASRIPIGRPIANTQLYILDRDLQPVPIGVTGELYIGGAGVARGYLHRPDLTAERFIPHPFQAGERLYKTGDLARYLPDGTIDCLGRIDHQVKIRGYRVELEEIEAVLNQNPAVRDSVVMAREDAPGDVRLVAYIVLHLVPENIPEVSPTIGELQTWLKSQVPDYMMPSAFVWLDALPLTHNGKVNRSVLPAPEGLRPDLATVYTPPQTELEQTIAQIWQTVLCLDKVGVEDPFFDLGGHSLLLVQVHHHLQRILSRPIALIDLFQYPTIRSLARHLSQASNPSATPSRLQQIRNRAQQQRTALQQQQRIMQEEIMSERMQERTMQEQMIQGVKKYE